MRDGVEENGVWKKVNFRVISGRNRNMPLRYMEGQMIAVTVRSWTRDHVERRTIELTYCPTEEMVADLMTKGLNMMMIIHPLKSTIVPKALATIKRDGESMSSNLSSLLGDSWQVTADLHIRNSSDLSKSLI
jgi:hypothetical protein